MPIRVKPVHDLGPCLLDMDSIKGICALVNKTFHYAHYSATDGVWEIYDEESDAFLKAIEDRKKLDSFIVYAPSEKVHGRHYDVATITGIKIPEFSQHKRVSLKFDNKEAKAVFEVSPDQYEWVEHFMLDLKKYIYTKKGQLLFLVLFGPVFLLSLVISRMIGLNESEFRKYFFDDCYTEIILKVKLSNPSINSIRDNLAASIIYDIAKVILGIVIAILAVWLYSRFGLNIGEWLSVPGMPTPTP